MLIAQDFLYFFDLQGRQKETHKMVRTVIVERAL
ncbi:hypothetical protein N473_16455 [Pseudoalteromonas luteoviolacea CPMOR-1]|uniref:Uncharacterized protein n=1 Tax=Pseudoalteromonas luteoviolacea CPMOR-1 TaxID=1365248 RepID=A0A167L3N6_9GAMM|nr:hypothetical protein N473_16455 [Pseudoalteromonas luteoviolacea CPMOR-1]